MNDLRFVVEMLSRRLSLSLLLNQHEYVQPLIFFKALYKMFVFWMRFNVFIIYCRLYLCIHSFRSLWYIVSLLICFLLPKKDNKVTHMTFICADFFTLMFHATRGRRVTQQYLPLEHQIWCYYSKMWVVSVRFKIDNKNLTFHCVLEISSGRTISARYEFKKLFLNTFLLLFSVI